MSELTIFTTLAVLATASGTCAVLLATVGQPDATRRRLALQFAAIAAVLASAIAGAGGLAN